MAFLARIFGTASREDPLRPLYDGIVAAARDPAWYREGQVPDTFDGRFDMVAALLAVTLLRLEGEKDGARRTVLLTETFIADMDGTLRQIGIGDLMVGKHVGRMMSALGGRLAAFRTAFAPDGDVEAAVARNIFHDSPPSSDACRFVTERLRAFRDDLAAIPAERILAGEVPR